MSFEQFEGHPGLLLYKGKKVRIEYVLDDSNVVQKLNVYAVLDESAGEQRVEQLKGPFESREKAEEAGKESAAFFVDRSL